MPSVPAIRVQPVNQAPLNPRGRYVLYWMTAARRTGYNYGLQQTVAWSRRPQEALEGMLALNNKYALDGGDPNSYSGIFWVLGRFDRPWPERPVFGKVRAMTSAAARRKLRLERYLAHWGEGFGAA